MLKVCVDYDDDIPARVVEAGRERYFLAEIPAEIDDANCRIRRLQRAQQLEGIIAAAVIHENDLAGHREFLPNDR